MSSNIQVPKICQHCGITFVARTTVTRFCSHKCSQRNYKKRAREAKVGKTLEETHEILATSSPTSETPLNKEYLSMSEVAALLGVSRWTINRMLHRGQLNMKQVGRKKIIPRSQLDAFFQ
ncbi:helix-turn-helix domain-containing protein [Jiulongibacter sediminis]|uniref:Helix-turn-helix domain-containing protein n=1 Tax=Jiulongibacter sediminis TaxID=1605367 RepID=A0A0P7BYF6_9BACT|nr:helix-turn-helix domain-containing protein [Jiulongibacter sediminis]KPM46594.1 hypothetical protein AFM12_19245 [Jiulongibacter sediminis]TBX21167.1 hypothetical protein TK44_19250 [Jiulongibacter sediminis]